MLKTIFTAFLLLTAIFSYAQSIDSANFYYNKGYVDEQTNNHPESIKSYFTAIDLYHDIEENKLEAQVTNRVGILFYKLMQYNNAIHYYKRANTIFKYIEETDKQAGCQFNIGLCYYRLGNYIDAGNHYINAQYLYAKTNNTEQLAAITHQVGQIHKAINQLDSARHYYLKVIEASKSQSRIARAYNQVGMTYKEQNDSLNALIFFKNSLSIKLQLGDSAKISTTLNNIAEVSSNPDTALNTYLLSLNYIDTSNYANPALFNTFEKLTALYEQKGDLKTALSYSKMSQICTIALVGKQNQVAQDKRFYEGQLILRQIREFELQKQQKQERYVWLWIFGFLISAVAIYFGNVLYIKRKTNKWAKMEITAVKHKLFKLLQ